MARRGGRPSKVPPPPPVVVVTPSPPREPQPPPQVFVPRPIYRCTSCGSAKVKSNGVHPPVAYFVCGRCTDDEGNATTFKLAIVL